MCTTRASMDQASSAVNVFVTGQPGIGKTTLVQTVAKELPKESIAGFYTVEARAQGSGEKLGLDVVTFSGERAPLSRLRRGCGPKVGKYYVALDDFERLVIPQLTPSRKIKLHIIDEIGKLELSSEKFRDAVLKLLDSPAAVFGALPAPRYGHTLEEVEAIKQRPDTAVLTLTKNNRAITAQEVTELLKRVVKDAENAEVDRECNDNTSEDGPISDGKDSSTVPPQGAMVNGQSDKGENSEPEEARHQSSCSDKTPQHSWPLEAALAQVADAILD